MAVQPCDPSESSEIPSRESPSAGSGDGPRPAPPPGGARPHLAVRLLLLGAVLLAGLAVASPGGREVSPQVAVAAGCPVPALDGPPAGATGGIVLPPGHPPIPGMRFQGPGTVRLPPGHPPIDGRPRVFPLPARPSSPVFQSPAMVDL